MKRVVLFFYLCLALIAVSCSKDNPDDAYHNYWWESETRIDGNHLLYFRFREDGIIDFKSYTSKTFEFFPKANTSHKYVDNGDTIDLQNYTVTGHPFGSPKDNEIVFHKATWKGGKPKDVSETIFSDLIIDYTFTSYKLTGEIDEVIKSSCTFSSISGEPKQ